MTPLWARWKAFGSIIFDPWSFFLLLLTIATFAFSTVADSKALTAVLTAASSLLAGVVGGVWTKQWLDRSETRALVVRGKSAIGSLNLLLINVAALQQRVMQFIERRSSAGADELTATNLEEVVGVCKSIQEHVIHSIEDWTDIVPGAVKQTQIGVLSDLGERVQTIEKQRDQLTKEVGDKEGKSQEAIGELSRKLEAKEQELTDAREQFRRRLSSEASRAQKTMIDAVERQLQGLLSMPYNPPGISDPAAGNVTCPNCGSPIRPEAAATGACPKCRALLGGPDGGTESGP